MKVLVTGGSGFVGARTIDRLLANGHEVVNLDVRVSDRHPERTTLGDVRDADACLRAMRGADAVLHLAALYRDDVRPRELYYQVNVDGTGCIARAAAELGVRRIVFTSSFSVYGLEDAGKSESGALDPVNDYGRSKLAAESLLREWLQGDASRSLQVLRPSVIFGEGNRGNVWTLLNQIARGRFALIGRGANRKSMAYVGNVAEFLLFLLGRSAPRYELYNYADKPDMSVSEIVDTAARELGRSVLRVPVPGRIAMLLGYGGDVLGRLTGKSMTLNSERVRKFLADTTLPTARLESTGFARPFELNRAFVQTIRSEFAQR